MASPKQPSVAQMLEELRQQAVGPRQPLTPIDTARRNLQGMYEKVSSIPANIKRMVSDPVAYAKSLPAPTGEQIMNAIGPGNVGMAGIMIGPKAKTWNVENAYKAVQMEHAGATPQEIWQATGTYRGPEGKWRQEIDDSKAVHRFPYEIKQKASQLQDQQAMLKAAARESLAHGKEVVSDLFPKEAVAARKAVKQQVSNIDDELGGYFGLKQDPKTRGNLLKYGYDHPELYAAYPELADYVLSQGNNGGAGTLGSLSGKDVNLYLEGLAQKQPSSTVAHELQHAIQDIEGLPRGGNVYEFMKARHQADDAVKAYNDSLSYTAKKIDETTDPSAKQALQETYDQLLKKREKVSSYVDIDPYQEYRKLGGEAESRMIQERLNMTPEERAQKFPMESYDKDLDPKNLRLLNQGEQVDIYKAQGGTVNPFDYENPKHVENVASIAAKHRDFNQIPDAAKHLAGALSQGSYKFIEDPRIQQAIKQAGHSGHFINHKNGKERIVHKAMGGGVQPSISQMQAELNNKTRFAGLSQLQSIGANEAPSMGVKAYVPPTGRPDNGEIPVGGVDTHQGDLPVGGIDMNGQQPGQQLQPTPPGQQPGMDQVPQGDKIGTIDGTTMAPTPNFNPGKDGSDNPPPQGGSNILNMTPQGQAMSAMKPQGLKSGGQPKKSLHYAPSPALMKAEIEAHAERMARQMAGLDNPNQKTLQQLAREKNLSVDIRKGAKKQEVPVIDWEKQKGAYSIGVPGDPSRGGLVPASRSKKRFDMAQPKAGEYLNAIGGEKLESPVPMYGGKDYGAYGHPEGWASDLGASAGMFNVVKRLAEEDPSRKILGHYHKMSPESLNHAVHMMDAVLSYHQPHKAHPEHIGTLNHLMRNVATTTSKNDVPYPEFPGFENPNDVMFHGALNSGMRKKIIGLLGKEKNFPGGKQKLDDLIYAMSHPELRNIETGAGGSSILEFDPTRELRQQISSHPTYGHDIPSKLVGRTKYIVPAEILAPRSMHNAAQEIKAMGKKVVPFNQAKMNIIREPIEEQYINQMGEYENAMRKRLGYKKGGGVKLHTDKDTMALELSRKSKKAK
jgi:Large polyvalent protein associated domain 23